MQSATWWSVGRLRLGSRPHMRWRWSRGMKRATGRCFSSPTGRLDGFWESGLSSWDLAAGALIVREAGGLVTDYSGDEHYLEKGQVVAGNPKIIAEMLHKIQRQLGAGITK